jgi:hypothetical protein
VLVSHRHHFIFIHVYKKAGMSVRRALDPYAEGRWRRQAARFTYRAGLKFPRTDPMHLTAARVRERLSPDVYDRYYKFAFVRNPWAWQVSLYHYMLKRTDHFQNEFVRGLGGFDPYIRWRVAEEVRLQREFLSDDDGRLLVDYVGRMETLNDDFAEICRTIGLPHRGLPHKNRSSHRDYRAYYTDETRDLVAEAFAADIDAFGYTFDGLATEAPALVGPTA